MILLGIDVEALFNNIPYEDPTYIMKEAVDERPPQKDFVVNSHN